MTGCPVPIAGALVLTASLMNPPAALAAELDDLLKSPVSPGTLGLMATHSKDPRVGIRWREALVHPSPQVRAIAARLLLVSGDTGAIPALRQMLETDSDPGAVAEAARGLLIMATGPTEALVLAAAQRLKAPELTKVLDEERDTAEGGGIGFMAGSSATFRTVDKLPQGYVEDVLRVTGCKPSDEGVVVGAVVRYNEARHLQEVRWASTFNAPCTKAGRAILVAALLPAPPDVTPGEEQWIVLPVGQTFLQCLAEAGMWHNPEKARTKGLQVRKTKHVNPTYPERARQERRQGLVILQATASETGCVRAISVVRTAGLDLDVEAIRTVAQWAFAPVSLDGVPVPVEFPVTVMFTLTK
jgi:TonB family protein